MRKEGNITIMLLEFKNCTKVHFTTYLWKSNLSLAWFSLTEDFMTHGIIRFKWGNIYNVFQCISSCCFFQHRCLEYMGCACMVFMSGNTCKCIFYMTYIVLYPDFFLSFTSNILGTWIHDFYWLSNVLRLCCQLFSHFPY